MASWLEKARAEVTNTKEIVYPELLDVCRQLRQEFEDPSSKFEKASLLHDLLLLFIYCTGNTGRAK